MLSLIPALLLLAFQGPSALERFEHDGRLPEALRALERVWAPQGSDEGIKGDSRRRKVYQSLAALTSDPAFSQAVSEIFGLELAAEPRVPADATDLTDSKPLRFDGIPDAAALDGYSSCRRTRDGPLV
jgi:hypothetical protein